MEIGAATSSSYLPTQLAEQRQAKVLVRDFPGARENTTRTVGERPEGNNPRALVSGLAEDTRSSQAARPVETPGSANLRSKTETSPASTTVEAQRPQQAATAQAGGSIKLDIEEGDRVMKVFDSNDVLIYQLPPKGALMLIKAQEQEQQSQVKTSA
jgi:hypothetical protein